MRGAKRLAGLAVLLAACRAGYSETRISREYDPAQAMGVVVLGEAGREPAAGEEFLQVASLPEGGQSQDRQQ